jgi:hypothetical protein
MTASPKINLVYNKYVKADKTKDISKKEFYTNLQTQTQTQPQPQPQPKSSAPLCVYLTNGTNKELNSTGNGTTAAFKQLSDISGVGNLFNLTDAKTVFDSSSNDFNKKSEILHIISDTKQVWTHSNSTYKGKYAGSVIRVDASGNGNNKDFPVCGGYHINGIKLNDITDSTKVETNSVELVKAYYTAIMEDFFKIATAAPSGDSTPVKHHVLHLAQIPGDLYGGTKITGNAFHTAVTDWIASKVNVSMSMTISVDFENPAGNTPPPAPPKLPVGSSSSSLKNIIDAVAATKKSHPLFTVANDIYNAFFGTAPKTGTKESLTAQLTQIENAIPQANKEDFQSRIEKVRKDLQNAAVAATSTATTTPTPTPTPVKLVTKKDVVFAFDIDNTLVQHGKLAQDSSFNAATHAANYDEMIKLMKDIIKAEHYVWIVTANNKITKKNFEKIYLKSDTDTTSISNSAKYYFMNPALVTQDLSGQFKAENFTSFNTSSPPLTHDLSFNSDDAVFQSKGLKPYAMRAKWMQLRDKIDDTNVEMYLFDDNTEYQKNCNLLKVKFVKVTSDVPPPFRSDVFEQASQIFKTIKTISGPGPTSGGGNLNVMTFNTWYEVLGDSPKPFCNDGGNNKCQNNIRQAILDHMKKHEQTIVFLQEFTYKFDEFFKVGEVTVNNDGFASTETAKGSSSTPPIPAFRYFTMTYDSKTFHVYIGQIGHSVIATIYSETFHNGPADAFFVGNLAAGNLKAGSNDSQADSYDLAYTFSGDKSSGVTETKPPTSGHAFGGNRPFIILRFDTKPCVLVNVHVPHGRTNDVFRDSRKNATGKPTGTLADFAFNALERFIPDTVFNDKSKTQNEYAFILGGDFNTDKPKITGWLTESTKPAVTRTTGTCCTTNGEPDFTKPGAVDHIFSTLPITKYTVHDISKTERTATPSRYFFSDHLPVYAEINFTTPHAATSSH